MRPMAEFDSGKPVTFTATFDLADAPRTRPALYQLTVFGETWELTFP